MKPYSFFGRFCATVALSFMSFSQSSAQGSPEYNKWVLKGFELYGAGQYKASAEAYTKAFKAGQPIPEDRYSAACSWALAGNVDSAFRHLLYLAGKDNFTDITHLEKDSDLKGLHTDKRWPSLIEQVKQNKEKAENLFNKPLSLKLDSIYNRDQDIRRELISALEKNGRGSAEVQAITTRARYSDSLNLREVTAIIDKYGWPGPAMVGHDGSAAVFLVIQHADLKTQDKYLPVMRKAVKEGNAQPSDLAMLEDRVAVDHGRKQTYGTQISTDPSGDFLAPLSDPDHVDQRRAGVGLGPIAEYLESYHLRWNATEYKNQLPALEKRQKAIH